MKFLADESVDFPIVARLREDGHKVDYVAEIEPGLADVKVLEKANETNALLISCDKDFGELVFRQGRVNAGVVLLRLEGLSEAQKATLVSSAIARHSGELAGAFTVVASGMIRIRRLLS